MFNEILKVYMSDNHIDYTETEQLGKILLHPLAKSFLKLERKFQIGDYQVFLRFIIRL